MGKKMFMRKYGGDTTSLIFTIDTTLGVGASFEVPTSAFATYNYNVEWGDGNTDTSNTGNASHTYSTDGVYQIKIDGTFPRFFFNNTGDKLKLTSVNQWGDVNYTTSQANAFRGCLNLMSIADDCEWINSVTNCYAIFSTTGITALPSRMKFSSITNGSSLFYNVTINTDRYSKLLIDLDAYNLNNNVEFHGGYSKYNSSAVSARANLIDRGWDVTDGGLEE